MIAKVIPREFEKVNKDIQELIEIACNYQDKEVVRKMKHIVPEFKSNNSIFEELDQKQVVHV